MGAAEVHGEYIHISSILAVLQLNITATKIANLYFYRIVIKQIA
jgi:hypothetical protein